MEKRGLIDENTPGCECQGRKTAADEPADVTAPHLTEKLAGAASGETKAGGITRAAVEDARKAMKH
jgi:hypothetical protein